MRLKIDQENDVLYFRLDETAIFKSEEIQPGVILDYDKNGQVIGIEILGIQSRIDPEKLRKLQFETV